MRPRRARASVGTSTMPDWQERITHDTPPQIRLEHGVRYAAAAPPDRRQPGLVRSRLRHRPRAAEALGDSHPGRALLVDLAEEAIRRRGAVEAGEVHALRADLTDEQDLTLVRGQLARRARRNGLHHLLRGDRASATFVPLAGAAHRGSRRRPAHRLLSVPNDAFWSMQNPFHRTAGAKGRSTSCCACCRTTTCFDQQSRSRDRLVPADGTGRVTTAGRASTSTRSRPDALLAASAPRAKPARRAGCWRGARPSTSRRTWERQRECDLAFFRALGSQASCEAARTRRRRRESRLRPQRPPPLRRRRRRSSSTRAGSPTSTASTRRSCSLASRTSRVGLPDRPSVPVLALERGAAASVRRRRRDLVGDDGTPLRTRRADRYAYFVQSLEDRFYLPSEPRAARCRR